MLKNLFKIVLLSIFCLYLAGCDKNDNRTVIKFASWGSKSEIDIIKPILSDFEKINPDIKVDFMHIPQNYFQKIHLLFASNTAPDIIFINNLNLPIYANAGVLEELDVSDGIYYPQALKALSYDGKLYAIPRDVSNLVIYYNQDLFDKKGIVYPKEDWTFAEFLTICRKLTDKNTFGFSFEEGAMYYLPFLMSEGGGILSDDLKENILKSSESQKGLKFYSDLRNKYHFAPRKNESASATMAQMFLQERLGMHLSGRWLVPKYRSDAKFRWDIVNFPHGDRGSIVPMDASGWAISKSSKYKKESRMLIDFLSSDNNIRKIVSSGLITPARIDSSNSKEFLNGLPANAKVFLNVIKTSKPTPVSIDYNKVLSDIKNYTEEIFEGN